MPSATGRRPPEGVTIDLMNPWVARVIGVVLLLIGGLWTLQGFGVVGGSFMTGSTTWLLIGLVLVAAGIALLARSRVRRR